MEGVAHSHLLPQQVLVPLLNFLQELGILNLQLLEVHLVKRLPQLFFLQTDQEYWQSLTRQAK